MNAEPMLFLHLVIGLMFAPDFYLGFDLTLVTNHTGTQVISIKGNTYMVLKTLFCAPMISGRGTKVLLCSLRGQLVIVKDCWIHSSQNPTEVFFFA